MKTWRLRSLALALALCLPATGVLAAPTTAAVSQVQVAGQAIHFKLGTEAVTVSLAGPGVVHVQAVPDGRADTPTLVMAPDHQPLPTPHAQATAATDGAVLSTARLKATLNRAAGTLHLANAQGKPLLTLDLAELAQGRVTFAHAKDEPFYGIGSYTIDESTAPGLLRTGEPVAMAGEQGHAGAPFVWTSAGYGVLVDSNGAVFHLQPRQVVVDGFSKLAVDAYLMVGAPKQLFAQLAQLSGHAPLFPKWSLGFINTQWGIDEKELVDIVDTYRQKRIPLDGFVIDFDWKAWGKDNYGEFRWNAKKFPDGPSGKLAHEMAQKGVHLGGIMKPRIHVDTVQGRYATTHDLWLPGERVSLDYFSHKPVKEVDFDKPAARAWFGGNAIKYGFDKGMVGWWNDEADTTLSNTQFMNMQRSLYVAQRKAGDVRAWSLNRNFWLGSQRYAYGMWSGDIHTGFAAMARQRARMLSAINVGEAWWGMDGGGFKGHPSDENYARWIEFGAFTPIFRVHGTLGEKRQPWKYGPVAQKAATRAIDLRYKLMPYIYSFAWHQHVAGVGLVRPLVFGWPHDAKVRNDVDAWMFGQWLLVSPVVKPGATQKTVYLPAGTWTDWFSGKRYAGGQGVTLKIDSKTWQDIPLFIRQGAIIPTQPVLQYVHEKPVTTVSLDVFPSKQKTSFNYYADDGDTYAYEHGDYYLQPMSTQRTTDGARFSLAAAQGKYAPALRWYVVKVHGVAATAVAHGGQHYATLAALGKADGAGWATGHDRYGPVTWLRVPARQAQSWQLQTAGDR
ncbi:MAG TPA: TIM-barrel domain-containing protein [Rhodanobacteraceae bacterium]